MAGERGRARQQAGLGWRRPAGTSAGIREALGGQQSAAGTPGRSRRRQPRQELTLVLLLGAAGAGLVLLVMRQGWAHVDTAAPSPLPASVTTVSGQALVPAAGALALAALAGLAAVLATRRVLRRIAGVMLAGFGAGITVAAGTGILAADVLAAASASVGAPAGSGAGGGSTPRRPPARGN